MRKNSDHCLLTEKGSGPTLLGNQQNFKNTVLVPVRLKKFANC